MTDIVERLRDPYASATWVSTLCSDAADEIERLRAKLARLQQSYDCLKSAHTDAVQRMI